jgi:hypothetical protein
MATHAVPLAHAIGGAQLQRLRFGDIAPRRERVIDAASLHDLLITVSRQHWIAVLAEWRASPIPDTGPNKVSPETEGEECRNGVGSSARNTAMKQ